MLDSKRRAIIFISLSLLLAAIAGFMFLQKVQALNTNLGEMAKIYVASTNISSRTELQPDQIKTKEVPKKFVDDSYITNKEDLINRVSVVPLAEGNIITKNMLKKTEKARDTDNRLVKINSSDKVGFDQPLEALDRVDIIVSHDFDGEAKTEVFMKDVRVAGTAVTDDKQMQGILVEVSAEDATRLIHMENYASSMRVLKANVGKETTDESSEKAADQEKKSSEEQKSNNKKKKDAKDKDNG